MGYVDMPKSNTGQCLVLLLSSQLLSVISQQGQVVYSSCQNLRGNFTIDSSYEVNLKSLISSLSSLPQNENGFYNVSVGETDDDKVNSLMLCRGDVKPIDCIRCIVIAGQEIRERCPNQREANIWYDHCMLRYSDRTILNTMETSPGYSVATDFDFPGEKDVWENMLTELLDGLMSRAAAGGQSKKFAVSKMNGSSLQTLYGLMQCTPEISERDCIDCLTWNIGRIPILCNEKLGCRQATVSCNLRYDTFRFYDLTAEEPTRELPPPAHLSSPPLPPLNERASDGNVFSVDEVKGVIFIVILIVGCIIFVIASCVVTLMIMRQKKNNRYNQNREDSLRYEFSAIRTATNNFSPQNELGQGGFGKVYQGVLNGKEVAVKRLSENGKQGEVQFKNEVMSMANLSHRNLVRLVGFSVEENERALIYEFLPNKSLDKFIFDKPLEWATRYNIIEGVARGILYLHQDCHARIIHRDLKPANVLLDKDMTPKVADFGLAKLFDESQISLLFTENPMGTEGYIAPEYREGQFSFKTDVYSFGVLVLEILSGKRMWKSKLGENGEDLIAYAKRMYKAKKPLKPEDSNLEIRDKEDILHCMNIGLGCVEKNPSDRPEMRHVVLMLEKNNGSQASEQRSGKGRKSRIHV
ncbi:Cysteine-rich receptor-like protein kinase 26 [Cardamine amara subsp. amara]|uniref:Cysteine-rich receptor-like protein kinase 26 n=1 Tax=Cardamine amara subsp. amara TaxID=228776 RepID=A0ABD1C673_CARAN